MPRQPKMYLTGQVYELCFRTEEGLPMVCAAFMIRLLEGYLAMAQKHYPVTICHCTFMANHVHMIIKVINPEHVPEFCGYFKRESAHAINRLLGRIGHTVWAEGYDSPIILDPQKILDRIVYLYCNPVRAGLTESIENYPHITSWEAFVAGGRTEKVCKRMPRDQVPSLPTHTLSAKELEHLDELVQELSTDEAVLCFEPDAWMSAFEGTSASDPEILRREVMARIRQIEEQATVERKVPVIGVQKLIRQNIRKPHTPEKRSPRTICLSSTRKIRQVFRNYFLAFAEEARGIRRALKFGVKEEILPSSFFYQGGYLLANLIPFFSPLPLA